MRKPSTETFTGIWAALGAIALVFALLTLTGCGSVAITPIYNNDGKVTVMDE